MPFLCPHCSVLQSASLAVLAIATEFRFSSHLKMVLEMAFVVVAVVNEDDETVRWKYERGKWRLLKEQRQLNSCLM